MVDGALDTAKDISYYIRYYLKGIQTEIDKLNPFNEDNSDTPVDTSVFNEYYDGTCIKRITSRQISGQYAPDNTSYQNYYKYHFNVSRYNPAFVSDIVYLGGDYTFITNNWQNNQAYYNSMESLFYQNFRMDITFKEALRNGDISQVFNQQTHYNQFHIEQNEFDYTAVCDNTTFTMINSYNTPELYIACGKGSYVLKDIHDEVSSLYGTYCEVTMQDPALVVPRTTDGSNHLYISSEPALFISNDNDFSWYIKNYYDTDYTDNSVTTYDNSTMHVYNGDNYIYIKPLENGQVTFNNFFTALGLGVDDINLRLGLDGDDAIQVPTYDELKYMDYSDFYIEPLHQYDTLPVAPSFDGSIELGDYPMVIGESANTFLSFLPASLSALFCAVFIISIILDNLRGRR